MKVLATAALTDPGRVRRRNEDAFFCGPPLFCVADGMGGAQAGELASSLAAGAFRDLGPADEELDPEARLRAIIQEANRRIYARAASDPRVSGMGTTVTACLVAEGRVAVGHVGDSRAYRLRDGQLEQLTQDHSLVADLVRSGRLTPEEAQLHPQRSVITRALGTDAAVAVDSFSVDARPGDVFLLCSDGLTTMVPPDALEETLAGEGDLDRAARSLVRAANAGGGEDNVTVVLFALGEGDPDQEDTFSRRQEEADRERARPPATVELDHRERAYRPEAEPGRAVGRALLVAVLVVVLFAALAAAALFGLSRAHFVGATPDGRLAVYQGVPWNVVGSIRLYRTTYVSRVQAVQLSPAERQALFDHSLVSEAEARDRIAVYERETAPWEGSP